MMQEVEVPSLAGDGAGWLALSNTQNACARSWSWVRLIERDIPLRDS